MHQQRKKIGKKKRVKKLIERVSFFIFFYTLVNIQLFSIVELAMILTGETRLKVKILILKHENDLEKAINEFIKSKKIIDIKYQISHFYAGNEQIYSFSALIMYENEPNIREIAIFSANIKSLFF